tara:strand:+ start:2775 stop:4232 length:1458 start_codon:yes stop_codon:yes gene_type:complete
MANKIQIKRSTSTATPSANQLAIGEVAYSYDSNKFFIGDQAGSSFEVVGGKHFTDYWPATDGTVGGSAVEVVTTDSGGDINFSGSDFTGLKSITSHTSTDLTLAAISGQSIILTTDTGISGTAIKDEDNMSSNSAVHLATQQSIKAYVDTSVAGISNSSLTVGDTSIAITDTGSNGTITFKADNNTELTITDSGVVVAGNLQVDGTTTTVNSTTTTVDDPIMTLGGDTAPGSDDNKDRGIEFRYHDGSQARVGFFGFDDSAGDFTILKEATNTAEVFSGTQVPIDAASYKVGGTSVLTNNTLGSGVVSSSLTSVGVLGSGSIDPGFGNIDNGTSNITTGGIVKIDVDGTAGAAGSLNFGTGGDTTIFVDSGDDFNIQSGAGNTIKVTAGDITFYDATNDGNPTISVGSSAAEDLAIEAIYDSGAQTLDYVKFNSTAASSASNKGQYKFFVDSTNIININDAGIQGQLASNAATLDAFTIDGGTFS